MTWCPKCHRHNIEYDRDIGHEYCLWRDCHWVNVDNIDLDKAFENWIKETGGSFKEFIKTLKPKKEIGI